MHTTLINGLYECKTLSWVLIHDGTNVITKALSGHASTKRTGFIMLDYASEALLDAEIVSLGLVDLPDEV